MCCSKAFFWWDFRRSAISDIRKDNVTCFTKSVVWLWYKFGRSWVWQNPPPPFIPFPGGTLSLPILKLFSPPLLIQSSTWQNNSSKTLTLSTELNGCMGLLCWEVWVLLQVLEEIKVFLSTISQIRNHFSLLLFCLNLFAVTDFLCDVSRGLLLYLS